MMLEQAETHRWTNRNNGIMLLNVYNASKHVSLAATAFEHRPAVRCRLHRFNNELHMGLTVSRWAVQFMKRSPERLRTRRSLQGTILLQWNNHHFLPLPFNSPDSSHTRHVTVAARRGLTLSPCPPGSDAPLLQRKRELPRLNYQVSRKNCLAPLKVGRAFHSCATIVFFPHLRWRIAGGSSP